MMNTRTLTWSLAGLAAFIGAVGLIYATRGTDANPAVAAVEPAAVAALPLHMPAAAPASQAAASAAPPPSPPPAPVRPAPGIGSEGYGPHIESAQAGASVAAAWEAVQWLQLCASNTQQRDSYERLRDLGQLPPQAAASLLEQSEAEARRCQTVTDQHRAMLPELAARAMHAGVPLAAAAYAGAVSPASLSAAQRQEVAEALRQDALKNGVMSLLAGVEADEAWGLSDAERLSFHAALKQMADEPGSFNLAKSLVQFSALHFKTPPTPEQQAAARLAGRRIVDRLTASEHP